MDALCYDGLSLVIDASVIHTVAGYSGLALAVGCGDIVILVRLQQWRGPTQQHFSTAESGNLAPLTHGFSPQFNQPDTWH